MGYSKLNSWFTAIRPFSFTGSVIPVIIGAMLALEQKAFSPGYLLLTLAGILLMHSGVNLLSDFDDFVNKVDTPGSSGSSGVLRNNLLKPEELKRAGRLMLISGFIAGVIISLGKDWTVMLFGIAGILLGYSYTGKPLALKYKGLGTPLIFLLFGPLLVMGSYYVQTQVITLSVFVVSIPFGLLTTAILHANDLRDIQNDKKAGIRTLSIIAGKTNAIKIYCGFITCAYAAVPIMAFLKIIPVWSLICLITFPGAFGIMKKLHRKEETSMELLVLDKITARLHAQFGSVLIVSLLLAVII